MENILSEIGNETYIYTDEETVAWPEYKRPKISYLFVKPKVVHMLREDYLKRFKNMKFISEWALSSFIHFYAEKYNCFKYNVLGIVLECGYRVIMVKFDAWNCNELGVVDTLYLGVEEVANPKNKFAITVKTIFDIKTDKYAEISSVQIIDGRKGLENSSIYANCRIEKNENLRNCIVIDFIREIMYIYAASLDLVHMKNIYDLAKAMP